MLLIYVTLAIVYSILIGGSGNLLETEHFSSFQLVLETLLSVEVLAAIVVYEFIRIPLNTFTGGLLASLFSFILKMLFMCFGLWIAFSNLPGSHEVNKEANLKIPVVEIQTTSIFDKEIKKLIGVK